MSDSETTSSKRFSVGHIVHHKRFNYRGVVIGIDLRFEGTDEWYDTVALSRPPKDRPWYHVLPHGATHQTYVADRNLEPDSTGLPVEHPLVEVYFTHFIDGRYVDARMN
jgi:heat shock protein HspQ